MWYEILPSAGIVFLAFLAPQVIHYGLNYYAHNGKTMVRNHRPMPVGYHDLRLYLRDKKITGSEYIPKGLEGIPDGPCK